MVTFARNPKGMGKVSIAVAITALLFTGCAINRDIMFKTPRGYQFDTVSDTLDTEFKIQPNDVLSFKLFSNDGFKMIDLINEDRASLASSNRLQFNYPVYPDGTATLPVIGVTRVAGLSVREAELLLEERYSMYYQKPFVLLTVGNRRVVVFPGGGGDAKVINLENNNTTLLEVLAKAGGIANRGDAHRVKLFRRDADGRKVMQFDLSDIDNLKYADVVMQADDVVYVQPNAELARGILSQISPVITLLTTTILVVGILRSLK
jgi:polysaccharide export outer membrane protein